MRIEWREPEGPGADRLLVAMDGGPWREATDVEVHLRKLLRGLVRVEDQPCCFDHHGYCQEHDWLGEPGSAIRA